MCEAGGMEAVGWGLLMWMLAAVNRWVAFVLLSMVRSTALAPVLSLRMGGNTDVVMCSTHPFEKRYLLVTICDCC